MKYLCLTHHVVLTVDGHRRKIKPPSGSWGGMPPCQLPLMKEPQEGTYDRCVVEKVT